MTISELTKVLEKAVKKSTGHSPTDLQISEPLEKTFGDFSTNVALLLAKPLKKNPRELAEAIIKALPKGKLIEKTEIAGPGFINFWLKDEVFFKAFEKLYKKIEQKKFGKLKIGKGKVAITDTSNPNVAKPMGVHHLLATVIGQVVNHLLKTSGYKLIKDNYLGDWGTQFGKLIVAIRKWGNMDTIKKDPIPELLKLYVQFHNEAEKHPELEDEGRREFKKLEDGDPENRKMWEWIRKISLSAFNVIWKRLGVSFDMIHGEGYYENKMPSVLKEGIEKGIMVPGEKGSLIIPMNDPKADARQAVRSEPATGEVAEHSERKISKGNSSPRRAQSLLQIPPCIVRKSDGATTYATRDLARIKDWKETYHADIGVVLCDIAQKLHHDQVNEAADKLGWNTTESVRVHFGRMSFPEGAMSTRKGNVVMLEDVLDEGEKRALEKIEEHKSELPPEEKKELARKMGIGAIKYNILSQNRFKNYTFDWDQMLSFEGNAAPYLQYAYTRTQSIHRKSSPLPPVRRSSESEGGRGDRGGSWRLTKEVVGGKVLETEEKSLIKKLLNYEATIEQSLKQYKPNLLCTYLFELAQSFSHFYNNLRVLDAETEEKKSLRLSLVVTTGYVLKHGLNLLGIEVPERM